MSHSFVRGQNANEMGNSLPYLDLGDVSRPVSLSSGVQLMRIKRPLAHWPHDHKAFLFIEEHDLWGVCEISTSVA
eukprot:6477491-Amphidinium_carterae.2